MNPIDGSEVSLYNGSVGISVPYLAIVLMVVIAGWATS